MQILFYHKSLRRLRFLFYFIIFLCINKISYMLYVNISNLIKLNIYLKDITEYYRNNNLTKLFALFSMTSKSVDICWYHNCFGHIIIVSKKFVCYMFLLSRQRVKQYQKYIIQCINLKIVTSYYTSNVFVVDVLFYSFYLR